MRLRSNDRYFDFSGDVEVEKQSKLFEAIDETAGDFSYQFDLPRTGNNMQILGFPTADSVKSIYKSVPCDLLDEDNVPMYIGQLRVEQPNVNGKTISCSFFSGNYNWMGLLSGQIQETDFSDLDTDLSEAEIINNGTNTEGIFFPLIDAGGLITRGNTNLVLKDFMGTIFVKTAFERIFRDAGINIQGDLLNDPVYNSALISRLTIDPDAINNRSCYVGKGSDQIFVLATGTTTTKLTFTDETTVPFFDGAQNNFASSTYTADVKMDVKIQSFYRWVQTSTYVPGNDNGAYFKIYINGLEVFSKVKNILATPLTLSIDYAATLDAGDTIEWYVLFDIFPLPINVTIFSDSWVKVTPSFLFKTFGNSLLPNWTKAKLINNVLSLFCCICDYEPVSKTLTIDFFNNIKSKEPIDLSDLVTVQIEDTSYFISNFAKNNLLKYADSDFDAIKQYNVKYAEPYAAGIISVDNDFIPDTETIIDSDFKAPVSYINPVFAASLERVGFVEMQEKDSTEFTSIQDNGSGFARINMADASIFDRLDLCRIKNSTVPEYNGDWLITTVSTTYIIIDKTFSVTAKGTVSEIDHEYTNTEDVHIFISATYDDDNVSRYSNNVEYQLVENLYSNISYAFFNMLNVGVQINEDYKQSLAFGVVKNQLSYQRTLLDTYWPNVDNVLNDPVKLFTEGHIPKHVFLSLTPLRPIRMRTLQTNNLYYLNRITGYKNSYTPCIPELIKLS